MENPTLNLLVTLGDHLGALVKASAALDEAIQLIEELKSRLGLAEEIILSASLCLALEDPLWSSENIDHYKGVLRREIAQYREEYTFLSDEEEDNAE